MKRKLLALVEDMTYQALDNLDLDKTGEEAAREAVRQYIGGLDLEERVFQAVKDAMEEELKRGAYGDAVIAAVSDWTADIVGGWLS